MERRLVTGTDIIGQMARYAVKQHPYNTPPRLDEVTQAINAHVKGTFKEGIESLRMQYFTSSQEICRWLRDALKPVEEIMQLWNTPASGHEAGHIFLTRYDSPLPEHDFIDIDALVGNVGRDAWHEAGDYTEEAA